MYCLPETRALDDIGIHSLCVLTMMGICSKMKMKTKVKTGIMMVCHPLKSFTLTLWLLQVAGQSQNGARTTTQITAPH
jgi:hypothetical protein